MFNGYRATEHEEKVVWFVDLFRCMRLGKNDSVTQFFSQKLLLVFFLPANISSLCSKYASSKEYYYLHLVFHTFTVKHLPRYGRMNFGSGKRFGVDNLSVDWLCTGTRIHKNYKSCSFSVFRF